MNSYYNITTNAGGIPYLEAINVTVGTENVNVALGPRRLMPVGYFTVYLNNIIPADTTTTLPVILSMNGSNRPLTLPNGTAVTAEELIGVNVIQVFNDRPRGILALMSRTIA
jgi:hypothetical protein